MSSSLPEKRLAALYELLDFHARLKNADEGKVWARVVDKLAVALDAEAATYFSYLPAKRHLIPRYALGGFASFVTACAIDAATGVCGWVARHRKPALVDDAHRDERFFKDVDGLTGFKTRSVLAVPLIERREVTGVIELLNKRSGPFTAEDLRFALAACRATATVLRALRLEGAVTRRASRKKSR